MPRERLSLKARALVWLAQREHSRTELRRKLLRAARAEQALREAREADFSKDFGHRAVRMSAWT